MRLHAGMVGKPSSQGTPCRSHRVHLVLCLQVNLQADPAFSLLETLLLCDPLNRSCPCQFSLLLQKLGWLLASACRPVCCCFLGLCIGIAGVRLFQNHSDLGPELRCLTPASCRNENPDLGCRRGHLHLTECPKFCKSVCLKLVFGLGHWCKLSCWGQALLQQTRAADAAA